jgi:hypothetical protein
LRLKRNGRAEGVKMSLLAKVRQDAATAAASAEARLRGRLAEPTSPPLAAAPTVAVIPPLAELDRIDPPNEWTLPASHGGWPVVQFHEGDWPAAAPRGASRQTAEAPTLERLPDQPRWPAEPCACSCPYFWESLSGLIYCCECRPIPLRRFAKEAWQVMWDALGQTPYWATWEPKHWKPFAHLEAAEGESARSGTEGF